MRIRERIEQIRRMKIIRKDISVIRELFFELFQLVHMIASVGVHVNFLEKHKIHLQNFKFLCRPFYIRLCRLPADRLTILPRCQSTVLHLARVHEETVIRSICPESYIICHRSIRRIGL